MTRRPALQLPAAAVRALATTARTACATALTTGQMDRYYVEPLPWWRGVRVTAGLGDHTASTDLGTRLTRYPHAVRHAVHGLTLTLARRAATPMEDPR